MDTGLEVSSSFLAFVFLVAKLRFLVSKLNFKFNRRPKSVFQVGVYGPGKQVTRLGKNETGTLQQTF